MAEYRLFDKGTIPFFTTIEFFEAHPWIEPSHQLGHRQRTEMVAELVKNFVATTEAQSISDLGCGDGSLLSLLTELPQPKWGYDGGADNVRRAQQNGLDVRQANLFNSDLEYGDLLLCTEVLEHLVDPHGYLEALPGDKIIVSSPSAEDADWHYEHHAWAWDLEGYANLVTGAGWTIVEQTDCAAEHNYHNNVVRAQRFQAIAAVRNG